MSERWWENKDDDYVKTGKEQGWWVKDDRKSEVCEWWWEKIKDGEGVNIGSERRLEVNKVIGKRFNIFLDMKIGNE